MANASPTIPANYGSFQINQYHYVQIGPVVHQLGDKMDTQNNYMGCHTVQALGTQVWILVTPFLTNLIIATTATQLGAPPPPTL